MNSKLIWIATLSLLAGLLPLSMDIYLPTLPQIIDLFHTTPTVAQLTLSVFMIVYACSQLIVGPLSDQYGRLPILYAGLGIYIIGSLCCAFAQHIEVLVIGRGIQAFGGCTGLVLSVAIVRDRCDPESGAKIMSYMASMAGMAPVVAPVLGGIIATYFSWRANFLFLVFTAFGAAFLVRCVLSESNIYKTPFRVKDLFGRYCDIMRHSTYRIYAISCLLSFMALFAFISYSPYLFISVLKCTPSTFGWLFGSNAFVFVMSNTLYVRFVGKVDRLKLLQFGFLCILSAGTLMGMLSFMLPLSIQIVMWPMYLAMVGIAFVMPNSIAGAITPFPHLAATASALLGFLRFGLAGLVATILIFFRWGNAFPLAYVLLMSGILGSACLILHRRATLKELACFANQ